MTVSYEKLPAAFTFLKGKFHCACATIPSMV